jgi:hypothetical protein
MSGPFTFPSRYCVRFEDVAMLVAGCSSPRLTQGPSHRQSGSLVAHSSTGPPMFSPSPGGSKDHVPRGWIDQRFTCGPRPFPLTGTTELSRKSRPATSLLGCRSFKYAAASRAMSRASRYDSVLPSTKMANCGLVFTPWSACLRALPSVRTPLRSEGSSVWICRLSLDWRDDELPWHGHASAADR